MKKRGLASGNFRMDSGRRWDAKQEENQPNALKARERMLEKDAENKKRAMNAPVHFAEAVAEQQARRLTPQSLTDQVVADFMGGFNAAEKQAKAYQEVIDNFKNGKGAREPQGSLAAAARSRMIERHEQNSQRAEKCPDIGRDKANRKAYPAGGGRNV